MKRSLSLSALLVAGLVALAAQAVADVNSLRGVAEIPATAEAPAMHEFINDKENVERTFKEQPPLVPHDSEKYTISLKENKCLDCHMKQPGKDVAKSVEMGESHFVDRDGNKLDKPSSRRYFCNQCHVPQVDAPPLVGNVFKSVAAK